MESHERRLFGPCQPPSTRIAMSITRAVTHKRRLTAATMLDSLLGKPMSGNGFRIFLEPLLIPGEPQFRWFAREWIEPAVLPTAAPIASFDLSCVRSSRITRSSSGVHLRPDFASSIMRFLRSMHHGLARIPPALALFTGPRSDESLKLLVAFHSKDIPARRCGHFPGSHPTCDVARPKSDRHVVDHQDSVEVAKAPSIDEPSRDTGHRS